MISLEGFLWLVVVGLGVWAYRSSATQQTTAKAAPAPKKAKKKPPRPAVRADEKACGVSRAMLRNGLVLVDANNVRGSAGPGSCDAAAFCGAMCRWARALGLDQRVVAVVDHGDAPATFLAAGLVVQFAGAERTADDAIVGDVAAAARAGLSPVLVATSDAELKRRCRAAYAAAAPLHAPPLKLVSARDCVDKWLHGGGAATTADDEWVYVDRGALKDHTEDPDPGWHPFHPPRSAGSGDEKPSSPTKKEIRKRKKHTTVTTRETTSSRVAQAAALYAQVAAWDEAAPPDAALARFLARL